MSNWDFYEDFSVDLGLSTSGRYQQTRRLKENVVDDKIRDKYGPRIERVGTYRTRKDRLRCKCHECGCEFLQPLDKLLANNAMCECNPLFKLHGRKVEVF